MLNGSQPYKFLSAICKVSFDLELFDLTYECNNGRTC